MSSNTTIKLVKRHERYTVEPHHTPPTQTREKEKTPRKPSYDLKPRKSVLFLIDDDGNANVYDYYIIRECSTTTQTDDAS